MNLVSLQAADFDSGRELALLETLGSGAVVSFTGQVRGDDGVGEMWLEHHPAMTEAAMNRIVDAAMTRWTLAGMTLIHRHGLLKKGERIVFVGAAARHRDAAFAACSYVMDLVKTEVPFWKCEQLDGGKRRWVEAKRGDDENAARWAGCDIRK